jgi:hypothetical protein
MLSYSVVAQKANERSPAVPAASSAAPVPGVLNFPTVLSQIKTPSGRFRYSVGPESAPINGLPVNALALF